MKNDKNESTQTYERGRSENVLQTCLNTVKRYKDDSKDCRMKIWYKKRDASWNACIVLAKGSAEERYLCPDGQGWDIVDAVEKYRINLLQYFDNELKPETSFTNLYEIDKIFDRKQGIERNDLGAEVDPITGVPSMDMLLEQLEELSLILKNIQNGKPE